VDERLFAVVLLLVAGLQVVAKATKIAYPIVFVLAGVALALIPGTPNVRLRPELVFLIFLPPLLYGDGWTTDFRQFVRFSTPIGLLATGPVIVTTLGVAWLAHAMLGLPYAVGATLGAILAPTDAVATEAIAGNVGLPRRLATILSGESLVNDATGLVLYRFAVPAVATGAFSLSSALLQFSYAAVAGIAIGIIGGYLIGHATAALNRSGLGDASIAMTVSLVAPYALYIPADVIGASGLLAAVAGGMYLSRKTMLIFDADARIAASGVWNLLFFTFNGTLFILIGLQLRSILASLAARPPAQLAEFGIVITATVVVLRFAWVVPAARLRWILGGEHWRQREGAPPPWQATFIVGWAGMRGIVSLAAALGIPEFTASGAPFPERDLVLFTTFVIILRALGVAPSRYGVQDHHRCGDRRRACVWKRPRSFEPPGGIGDLNP